jgi:dUTP pyrophosphatase
MREQIMNFNPTTNAEVLIKVLDGVELPTKSTEGSAGFDIAAYEDTYIVCNRDVKVRTGIFLEIPVGYVGLLVERSSLHTKGLTLANNIGIIDSDYRGEVLIALKNETGETIPVQKGQRIAQLIIVAVPKIKLTQVSNVDETARGCGGFGSSGF